MLLDFTWPNKGVEGDWEQGVVVELKESESIKNKIDLFFREPYRWLGVFVGRQ